MQTVRVLPLKNLPKKTAKLIFEGLHESGKVWNFCSQTHKKARESGQKWPYRNELQKLTKGCFHLHSQSVQMVSHAFLANVETAMQLKKSNPKIRLPYRENYFYPLMWPKQAVSIRGSYLILPMGKGRPALKLKVDTAKKIGACQIVWEDGLFLHMAVEEEIAALPKSVLKVSATVDLGQIHLAAAVVETGKAEVISGRGIRTIKQQRNKALGKIAKKQSRCKKGSRRHKKLQRAKRKVKARSKRRIRDQRHKATTRVINFCKENGVTDLFVGNPEGVQRKDSGRHHNQRMSQWEFGKDLNYLGYKAEKAGIVCFNGSERGTSSHCPGCGHQQKCKGRVWHCSACGLEGHRDIVGSVNMFPIGFGIRISLPKEITYLRPGPLRRPGRSSSLDIGLGRKPVLSGCLSDAQPALFGVFRKERAGIKYSLEAHPL